MSLFALFFVLLLVVAALVVGAYSHKWLAAKTGAPSNLNAANAVGAAKTAISKVEAEVKKL